MTNYTTINGWTKATMIEAIRKHVPENDKCEDSTDAECIYYRSEDGARCAVGAFVPDSIAPKLGEIVGGPDTLVSLSDVTEDMLPLSLTGLRELQEEHDLWDPEYGLSMHETLIAWIEANVTDA